MKSKTLGIYMASVGATLLAVALAACASKAVVPTPGPGVDAPSQIVNAAAQATKDELTRKPQEEWRKDLLLNLTEIAIAGSQKAGVDAKAFIAKLVAGNISLEDALRRTEVTVSDQAKENERLKKENAALKDTLQAGNERVIYWIVGIVGGALVLAGAGVAMWGETLLIPDAKIKGGACTATGFATLSLMFVVDKVLNSLAFQVGLGVCVFLGVAAFAFFLKQHFTQSKTLTMAVQATDKLKALVPDHAQVEKWELETGRVMDGINKKVVVLARKAGDKLVDSVKL